MDALPPLNAAMIFVTAVMLMAIGLFIFEVLRVDVAALVSMTLLGLAATSP